MLYVKTNNGLEGLHNLWNKIGKEAKLPFYKLTDILFDITKEVPLVPHMMCYDRIKRRVKKVSKQNNAILLWESSQNSEANTMSLLENIVESLKSFSPTTVDPLETIPLTNNEIE